MTQLKANGTPVKVGRAILRTPGISGQARSHIGGSAGMRAAEASTDALESALAAHGMTTQETIELFALKPVGMPGASSVRSTSYGEPAIIFDYPDPGPEYGQVVLAADESGVLTWNVAEALPPETVRRGNAMRTYVVRGRLVPPGSETARRGLLGYAGKKVLKVLIFPLIADPVTGYIADFLAARWERKNRAYALRTFTPADYDKPAGSPVNWTQLSAGPALLMVHGTFVRSFSAFGALPKDFVNDLSTCYEGRLLAFDHFTVSDDPVTNVNWLVDNIPAGTNLTVDIVCHSRGGLVSRELAERQSHFNFGSRRITVRKVIFVATPNAGTALADPKHMNNFIDSYTNLLNFFPDSGALDALEVIIAVVQQLAVGSLKGLDGLQAMNPTGPYLKNLNQKMASTNTRYFALASDYEPQEKGLKMFVADRLMDAIFSSENDLVVPTAGVYAANGATPLFPIEIRHQFDANDHVTHGDFFATAAARTKIVEWLQA